MKCLSFMCAAVVGYFALSPESAFAQAGTKKPDANAIAFFEAKIRPVLVNECYQCHSAKAARLRGSLYLDTSAGVLAGGANGKIIVVGQPESSRLIVSLRHGDLKMPPKKKLPVNVIADFEKWVRMGAPDPRTAEAAAWKRLSLEDAKDFWSFKPMKKHSVPAVKNSSWVRGDVDRFILASLETKKLTPVGDADRVRWIRRVTFDLVGLPPTPEEVEAFVNDKSSGALAKVVDRLLSSKHFGERWGRHWLDLARYAESNGNADNTPFPYAWRYRNYVIKSLNQDKPYNRFITEQIAGDLLPAKNKAERDDNLTATGFLALTSKPRAQNNPDYQMDLIADQIDVTCRSILGMTAMCARCHDHKFDPIPTNDYYALAGIFDSTEMMFGSGRGRGGNKKKKGKRGPNLHALSDGGFAMGVRDGKPGDTAVRIRGVSRDQGDTAPRGFLRVAITPKTKPVNATQSGRLELAAWLTQPDNPLTARVIVNRIWLHLFGDGLSRVTDNFGLHGEVPTHPELLDNLALKFIEDGWSIKKMIRHLVLTRTYQMSSDHSVANYKADPDNRLWWRIPAKRLDAEAIRDAMLAVSGDLIAEPLEGSQASVQPRRPNNKKKKKNNNKKPPTTKSHRSIYLGIVRNGMPESLAVFDVADPSLVVGKREVTTVPAQALYLLNSPFVLGQSDRFAERLLSQKSLDDTGRVDLAFRLALARAPTSEEREQILDYLHDMQKSGAASAAWTGFCQTLLASAEFRYLN